VSAPQIEERGSVNTDFFMPKIQPSIAVILHQLNIDAIEEMRLQTDYISEKTKKALQI